MSAIDPTAAPVIYHFHGKASGFHATYGLWIFRGNRGNIFTKTSSPRPRYFEFYGLSHFYSGTGWYWNHRGDRSPILEGQGVLSTPGFIQDYGATSHTCQEDAICFSGPIADHLFESGIIRNGVLDIGTSRRLLPVIEWAQDPSRDAQLKANQALQNLLIDSHLESKQEYACEKRHERLDHLIAQIKSDRSKWWTTLEMAEYCNISENQFRRVFKKHSGMAPKRFVDKLRMDQAAELLCSSAISIREVGETFGYSDAYHFSRRFKEIVGLAPERYRQSYAIHSFPKSCP